MNKIIPISFDERYMNHGKQQPEWTIQYYWGYNGCYFLNETESNSIIKVLDLITNQKSYTIKKGDVIYASKASELPRFKLKEFIKDNNLKKTSRHMYSDVIIINKGYFNELRKNLKIDNHIFCIEKHTKNTIKSIIKKSNVKPKIYKYPNRMVAFQCLLKGYSQTKI
jgi:hypothetical protein